MFLKARKSQAGFSLVELMVVVAIIGVLASIAVPQVNKYIAKARQSEAKSLLSSIYTSEKAFFAEYQAYHAMFGAIGFSPEGKLRYNAGFGQATASDQAGTSEGYANAPSAAPGNTFNTKSYCGSAGAMSNGCTILYGQDGAAPQDLPATYKVSTKTTFQAGAYARVFSSTDDIWTINNQKELLNPTSGIN